MILFPMLCRHFSFRYSSREDEYQFDLLRVVKCVDCLQCLEHYKVLELDKACRRLTKAAQGEAFLPRQAKPEAEIGSEKASVGGQVMQSSNS